LNNEEIAMKKCYIGHPGYVTVVAALGVVLAGLPGIVFPALVA
jgi:hypothetical protein